MVIHNQDAAGRFANDEMQQLFGGFAGLEICAGDQLHGNFHPENAALAGLALHGDVAAQKPGVLPADGQPKAGAGVRIQAGAGLLKFLKQPPHFFRRNAGAGVRDVHRQTQRAGRVRLHGNLNRNPAGLGEFDGIGEQVD